MAWKIFQLTIFVGVLFSNVPLQWTDNGMAAGLIAICAASFATFVVSSLIGLWSRAAVRFRGQAPTLPREAGQSALERRPAPYRAFPRA